jgi:hypothetical protein
MIGAYSAYQTELSNLVIELRDVQNLTFKQIADHRSQKAIAGRERGIWVLRASFLFTRSERFEMNA